MMTSKKSARGKGTGQDDWLAVMPFAAYGLFSLTFHYPILTCRRNSNQTLSGV